MTSTLTFKDWTFEVNKVFTEQTYRSVARSGAEDCGCSYCRNYLACRDNIFPGEITRLLEELGIDFRKEVEVTDYVRLPNGLHQVGGWFHFKGRVLTGKDYRVATGPNAFTFDLTPITDVFSIGFAEGNDLTFFEDKTGLVQVQFMATIPWAIEEADES